MAVKGNIITQAEIAELLGVSRGQVHMWSKRRERNGFPAPVSYIPRGSGWRPVYQTSEIKKWHRRYVPLVGGRPKSQ